MLSALEAKGITVKYGPVVAVNDVSLTVRPGRITGLIGANGAGKTSFIDAVSGFAATATGTVTLAGKDITGLKPAQRARLGLRRTFQQLRLFEDLTVEENLTVSMDGARGGFLRDLVRPRNERRDIERALAACGISETRTMFPRALSAGTRRLVGVARALVSDPPVLMLDEPAAGLDSTESEELGRVLTGLADSGVGLLLVEHDITLVLKVSHHVDVLDFGRLIASGEPDHVRHDPAVIAAYLGTESSSASTVEPIELSDGGPDESA